MTRMVERNRLRQAGRYAPSGKFGIGETLMAPSLPALANLLARPALRGRYNGAATLAWTSGFAVGPVLATAALTAGLGAILVLCLIGACGLAAIAALRLERVLPGDANLIGAVAAAPA
jgi:hypothetical protein